MMKQCKISAAAFAMLIATAGAPLLAHEGPRVWVAAGNGRLVTLTSDDDFEPSDYLPAQVFGGELSPFFGTYTTQFPGFEAPRDGSGGVGDGTWIGFKIAGPLLTLNAARTRLVPVAERFAGPASSPQLAVTFPDIPGTQYTRYTSAGVVEGFDFTDTITEHAHLAYTFLGDGTSATAAGPDGVFVLPMVLTSPGLERSDWFFLTFRKAAGEGDFQNALTAARTMASATPGDTNFDGAVNFDDLLALAQNYGTSSGAWWARGDFGFDGAVDFDDLLTLAQHYGGANFESDWAIAQTLVPEPAWASLLPVLAGAGRRRSGNP